MLVLLVTGIMFWRSLFGDYFSVDVIRAASLLHAVAATVLIIGIIVHVYAGIWTKGSFGAMVSGSVSEAWAKKHHGAWYRQVDR
jgi:formate dehydrogenase subunit gamma